MHKGNEKNIPKNIVKGVRGSVNILDIVDETITAGIRIVAPNSEVPKRIHSHNEQQVIYMISGAAEITNGVETLHLMPGDYVILEPNEEHYVITKSKEAKLFEIKFE